MTQLGNHLLRGLSWQVELDERAQVVPAVADKVNARARERAHMFTRRTMGR